MKFDPAKKENLTDEMRLAISQVLQYGLLDQMFSRSEWGSKEIVFHGGTSIHVGFNSPRRSEDLDFMLVRKHGTAVPDLVAESVSGLNRQLSRLLPGGRLTSRGVDSNDDAQKNIARHRITWDHPNKNGSVKVVLEFYLTAAKNLSRYRASMASHAPDGMVIRSRPELSGFGLADLTISSRMSIAQPISIYGDKLVAIAMRPHVKPRDYFDLWWLNQNLGIDIDADNILDTVFRSSDIYGYSDDDLVGGIERFRLRTQEIRNEMKSGVEKFLPRAVADDIAERDGYTKMVDHAAARMDILESALMSRRVSLSMSGR